MEAKDKLEGKFGVVFSTGVVHRLKTSVASHSSSQNISNTMACPSHPAAMPRLVRTTFVNLNTNHPERVTALCLKCRELSSRATGFGFQSTVRRIDM